MDIHLKYTNIEATPAINDYVEEKIGSLEELIQDIEAKEPLMGDAIHAWVEVGKSDRHHQKGKVWYAECQMRLPGKSIRAVSNHYALTAAIDEVKDELRRLIQEYKEKQERMTKEIKQ